MKDKNIVSSLWRGLVMIAVGTFSAALLGSVLNPGYFNNRLLNGFLLSFAYLPVMIVSGCTIAVATHFLATEFRYKATTSARAIMGGSVAGVLTSIYYYTFIYNPGKLYYGQYEELRHYSRYETFYVVGPALIGGIVMRIIAEQQGTRLK